MGKVRIDHRPRTVTGDQISLGAQLLVGGDDRATGHRQFAGQSASAGKLIAGIEHPTSDESADLLGQLLGECSVIGAIQRHGQIDDEIRSHGNLLGRGVRTGVPSVNSPKVVHCNSCDVDLVMDHLPGLDGAHD